jgi:hypothetical protein
MFPTITSVSLSPMPALLLCGAVASQAELAVRVEATLQRARPALLRHLARTETGMLAPGCLATAHDGVPTDDAVWLQRSGARGR